MADTQSCNESEKARCRLRGAAVIAACALLAGPAAAQYSAPPDSVRPWIPAFTKYTMYGGLSYGAGAFYSCGSGNSPMAAATVWAPEERNVWNTYYTWMAPNMGPGWSTTVQSITPQSCGPIVRTGGTEVMEAGLGECPDRNRRVGYASPYDDRNNPTNFTFRNIVNGYYTYPSCSVTKVTQGFNPYAGGAWSTTETISPNYNLYALCPEGWYSSVHFFSGTTPWCLPLAGDSSPNPLRNAGRAAPDAGEPMTCNPISIGTGNKYLHEVDYRSSSADALGWERHYNHLAPRVDGIFSGRWTHEFSRRVATIGSDVAWMYRPDGRLHSARLVDSSINGSRQRWANEFNGGGQLWRTFGADSLPNGWVLYSADRVELEQYGATGRLEFVARANGMQYQLRYSDGTAANGAVALDDQGNPTTQVLPAGLLLRVESPLGRTISIGYSTRSLPGWVVLPSGERLRYAFDAAYNPTSVTYLDGTQKQYRYGEAANVSSVAMPGALTGIVDESAHRFATYRYDVLGRAVSSLHWADRQQAIAVESVSLTYVTDSQGGPVSTTVTDALGTSRPYGLRSISGLVKQSSQSQPAGSGCGPSASALAYDANANVASRTDFNGVKTCYAYDLSRNLETKRVEGVAASADCATALTSPPAGARVISTQWHPDWRLETRIAEPSKITTVTYNGQGATCAPSTVLVDGKPPAVVCSRSEQATTDATGALSFGAGLTGTARTWTYTYTTYGRVLTATDPNGKTTTTTYYLDDDPDLGRRGNVATSTNAANHVTRITAYNLHGQPTQIVDPNGLTTDLTYDLRMRLTSRKVGSELTTFTYDPRGLLTNVTLPDGAGVTYTYDAAHRLIAIADQQGNRIDYTPDAMGNRITERATDSGGALVRNIQRTIDALNRVQQITGAGL